MQQLAFVHFVTPVRNPAQPEQFHKTDFSAPDFAITRDEHGTVTVTAKSNGESLSVSGIPYWFGEAKPPAPTPAPEAKRKGVPK